jgi:LPXTG-motif cell wall-anchored protein
MVDVKGIVASLPPAGMDENTKIMIYAGLILAIVAVVVYFVFLRKKSTSENA